MTTYHHKIFTKSFKKIIQLSLVEFYPFSTIITFVFEDNLVLNFYGFSIT